MGDNGYFEFALAAQHREKLSKFTEEVGTCGALDTCCMSNVAGPKWRKSFIEQLSKEDREKVKGPIKSEKIFKFGNNQALPSLGHWTVPVVIVGKKGTMAFDEIQSDIPLLISKTAMKNAKMHINIEDDIVTIFG